MHTENQEHTTATNPNFRRRRRRSLRHAKTTNMRHSKTRQPISPTITGHANNHSAGGGHGTSHNTRHEFLRLSPAHLIGDRTHGVLYRLLKIGLKDPTLSREVQLLDFDSSTNSTRTDLDAVFVDRLHAYINNGTSHNDPHWHLVISAVLKEKIGMRFVENNRRYYVLPTCVFVSDVTSQDVRDRGESPSGAGKSYGGLQAHRDTHDDNSNDSKSDADHADYRDTHKYAHSEEESDRLIDERRRETATQRRIQTDVHFYGFGIQINDGVSIEAVTAKLRGGGREIVNGEAAAVFGGGRRRTSSPGRKRGGDDADQSTHYKYLKLSQTSHSSRPTDFSEIAGALTGDAKLADTSDTVKRSNSAVVMIRGQLQKLFVGEHTHHVAVEIGDPTSTNSATFHIKYNRSKQATRYDPKTHDGAHHNAYYRQHGLDTRNHHDLDALLKKQLHKEDIVRYLTERGDFAQEKRIVLRYFHEKRQHHRYIVYTFPVFNAASKLAGKVVQTISKTSQPDLGDPIIRIYKRKESGSDYLLAAEPRTPPIDPKAPFDPALVVPKLVTAVEDEADSSDSTDADGRGGGGGGAPQDSPPDPNTDPIVQQYTQLARSSTILQFLSLLVLEVAQRHSGFGQSHSKSDSGDGVFRNHFKSRIFSAKRSTVSEPFRFNTSYLFMNLLLSASQHLQCLTYGQMSVRGRWFSSTPKSTGYLYNIISGANSVRSASGGLFHEQPSVMGGGGLSDEFVHLFTKHKSHGFSFGSTHSFGRHQSEASTADAILENLRHFYKDKLQSLQFHLRNRDDPDEFFFHLSRRNFWDMFSQRIQFVHGPFYKEVVRPEYHERFLQRLFYYQLKKAVLPDAMHVSTSASAVPERAMLHRIPTYYANQPDVGALVMDAHRSILQLRGLRFAPGKTQYAYTLSLLNQFGDDTQTTSLLNLSTSRDKTATDELLTSIKQDDVAELERRLSEMMKRYKVQDKTFLFELQRNNTRLLFHFLHFIENNGALDTVGNLHVTFRHIRNLHTLLEGALRVDHENSGLFVQKKSFFSSVFFRGTSNEKVAEHLFSMDPYLTLDTRLIKTLARNDGFRMMLHNWSIHKNLFWRIVDFRPDASFAARMFGSGSDSGKDIQLASFSLYAFLPTYIYLTREIRNLIPALEQQSRNTMDAIVGTQDAFQDKDVRKVYGNGAGGEMDALVRGLLFNIKQELLQSSETNAFIVRIGKRGSAPGREGDGSRYWLFAQWHRQYVLYDLGSHVRVNEAGLQTLRVDQSTVEPRAQRIPNLLDEKLRESSEQMRQVVQNYKEKVAANLEQNTTVHRETQRRQSLARRRSSISRKTDRFAAVHGNRALRELRAPADMAESVVAKHERVFEFIRVLQRLALHKQLLHGPEKAATGKAPSDKSLLRKPYQNNPMCAVMWLVFRDLYTFLPGMYNHVMMSVNDRLRHCEMGMALHTGAALPGGPLVPREKPLALAESGFQYYISSEADTSRTSTGEKRYDDERHYLLQLKGPAHQSGPAVIHRKLMFQMLLSNLAQLGQVEDVAASVDDTEVADVEVMSWARYVASAEVQKRLPDDKSRMLFFSTLLNGLFACNTVLKHVPLLRTAASMLYPSGLASIAVGGVWSLAKTMVPFMFSTGWAMLGTGMVRGLLLGEMTGGFSGLLTKLKQAGSTLVQGASEGNISGAFANLFGGAQDSVTERVGEAASGVGDRVRDTLTHYLVTNILMYRVTTHFVHNGSKYEWRFDIGVDRDTKMVLMYHGMPADDPSNQKVTAYRDIDIRGDETLNRIREHKQTRRRTSAMRMFGTSPQRTRSASVANRQPHTRRFRNRMRQYQTKVRDQGRERQHRLRYGG